MTRCFLNCRAAFCERSGACPIFKRLLRKSSLLIVVSENLRLDCFHVWKQIMDSLCNLTVELLAATSDQARIGRILDQGMFELVCRLWWNTSLKDQTSFNELRQCGV